MTIVPVYPGLELELTEHIDPGDDRGPFGDPGGGGELGLLPDRASHHLRDLRAEPDLRYVLDVHVEQLLSEHIGLQPPGSRYNLGIGFVVRVPH